MQILTVGRVTHVYTKSMNILMSVFSKLFFVLHNSHVALFNHDKQLIIVTLLNRIGQILPMQILQTTADADSFKKCRYLPMPINQHIITVISPVVSCICTKKFLYVLNQLFIMILTKYANATLKSDWEL